MALQPSLDQTAGIGTKETSCEVRLHHFSADREQHNLATQPGRSVPPRERAACGLSSGNHSSATSAYVYMLWLLAATSPSVRKCDELHNLDTRPFEKMIRCQTKYVRCTEDVFSTLTMSNSKNKSILEVVADDDAKRDRNRHQEREL